MVRSGFTSSSTLYLYQHIITKQVLQSPKKTLTNKLALTQLPPHKKLHAPLRRDHWVPLCKVEFGKEAVAEREKSKSKIRAVPRSLVMNQVYGRLLDYRRWRASERVPAVLASEGSAGSHQKAHFVNVPKKRRLREENEHVATSIADLAAAIETFTVNEAGEQKPVTIKWLDSTDAEHAERWSANVTHLGGLSALRGYKWMEHDASNLSSTSEPSVQTAEAIQAS
jgi:hypothetical protein